MSNFINKSQLAYNHNVIAKLFVEFAWNVITQTAGEIGTSEVSPPESPSHLDNNRKLSEETQAILQGLKERRFTLARMTSMFDSTMARNSVDIDDENLVPRSRRGSIFPACEFVDDFAEADPASRSRSSSVFQEPPLASPKRRTSRSLSVVSGGPGTSLNEPIKEVDED